MEPRCAICDCLFSPGEVQNYSGLANSNHLLHTSCMSQELEWMKDHGNYNPELLATYRNRLND
jgi:hypothetical protein